MATNGVRVLVDDENIQIRLIPGGDYVIINKNSADPQKSSHIKITPHNHRLFLTVHGTERDHLPVTVFRGMPALMTE